MSISEEYSGYDDGYDYSDYGEEGEEEKEEEIDKADEPRVNIANNAAVSLQIGRNSEVQINPGPNKSVRITFCTQEEGQSHELVINVVDGKCNIMTQTMMKITQAQPRQGERDEEEDVMASKMGVKDVYASLYKKVQ